MFTKPLLVIVLGLLFTPDATTQPVITPDIAKLTPSLERLKELGFEKISTEEYLKMMATSSLNGELYTSRTWYLKRGNCRIAGELLSADELSGINIIVDGDLTVDGALSDHNVWGMVVTGTVTAENIILNHGPVEFRRGTHFRGALLVLSTDDSVAISRPKGRLVYNNADSASFDGVKETDVTVFLDVSRQEYFGSVEKLLKAEFLDTEDPLYIEDKDLEIPSVKSSELEKALRSGASVFR